MKNFNLKIWQFLLIINIGLFVIKIERIVDSISFGYYYLLLLFQNWELAKSQFGFTLFDTIISPLILIFLIGLIIKFYKSKVLQYKLKLRYFFLLLISETLLFASLLANANPNFQYNLNNSRLKPPFYSLRIAENGDELTSNSDHFFYYKSKFINTYETDTFYSLTEQNKEHQTTKFIFLFGSDELGRDIYSRVVYGARFSLIIGIGSVAISSIIGTFIGFFAGYYEGFLDTIFNRIIDLFLIFPLLFFIIILLSLFNNTILLLMLFLGISGWMSLAKLIRGEIIELKDKDFIISAKRLGYSRYKLFIKEFLPNLIGPISVNLLFLFINVILAEASLSYLGIGVQDQLPTWGGIIEEGQSYLANAWWVATFPSLFLLLTLVLFSSIAGKIKKFVNPKYEL